MPTDRKVMVLLDEEAAEGLVTIALGSSQESHDARVRGRKAIRSALDKEATEREEWRIVGENRDGVWEGRPRPDRYKTQREAKRLSAPGPRPNSNVRIQHRTVTTIEDGAEYRSAWVDCEGEDG